MNRLFAVHCTEATPLSPPNRIDVKPDLIERVQFQRDAALDKPEVEVDPKPSIGHAVKRTQINATNVNPDHGLEGQWIDPAAYLAPQTG